MIILFLDFDGVTHPIVGGDYFTSHCIQSIAEAIDGFDVEIVISSTWRHEFSLDELKEKLGVELGNNVIGITPELEDPFQKFPRYKETRWYLKQNNLENNPWVALDDEQGNYPTDTPVIITNRYTGFTSAETDQLRDLLITIESIS